MVFLSGDQSLDEKGLLLAQFLEVKFGEGHSSLRIDNSRQSAICAYLYCSLFLINTISYHIIYQMIAYMHVYAFEKRFFMYGMLKKAKTLILL